MSSSIVNPYIFTVLNVKISLRPEQMDNKIYINLKDNLTKKVDRRCYKEYGFIVEVYKLTEIKRGIISAENLSGSAVFNAAFSCKLCRVVDGIQIVCKVTRINRELLLAENGPITIIIVSDKINNDVFFFDNNNNLRYKHDNKSKRVEQGDFVVVSILNKEFYDKDPKIKVIGYLEDIATDEDVNKHYEDYYKTLESKEVV